MRKISGLGLEFYTSEPNTCASKQSYSFACFKRVVAIPSVLDVATAILNSCFFRYSINEVIPHLTLTEFLSK